MNYRKKPIEVEAIQLFQTDFDFVFEEKRKIEPHISGFNHQWLGGDIWISKGRDGKVKARVRTLEGEMEIKDRDWLIKGVHNGLYPCKPDIFNKTYDPIIPLIPK